MKRYEDRNYGSLLFLFLSGTGLALVSALVLVLGWGMEGNGWVSAGGIGLFIGLPLFVFLGWELYSRPRLIADETGGVWQGSGTARFRWDDIASWHQVITADPEGEKSCRVELNLADGRLLVIEGNTVEDFVQVFLDFLPGKQGRTIAPIDRGR